MIRATLPLNAVAAPTSKLSILGTDSEVNYMYMGPERRDERRRERKKERFETMIRDFGLERRLRTERRDECTSWFLTSQNVVNS